MALIEEELEISKIDKILTMDLTLPAYQRPYSWSVKSTNTLFIDTYDAFKDGLNEYRLGTVILHKDKSSDEYNIVDGQQRLTTLTILLSCLGDNQYNMLNEKYDDLSNDAIVNNYRVLHGRINELGREAEDYKKYLLNQCTMVQIVTDSEQEAFQFFDSQNTRGKELAPHDLLKSYHLREMTTESENLKVEVINQWENIDQNNLEDLFGNYLFPLTQWHSNKDGLDYSSKKIEAFKGIKGSNVYNHSLYHKASNIYAERFNENGSNELLATEALNQFQLTQPLIAGRRFFNYTLHYRQLLERIQKKVEQTFEEEAIPSKRSGDIYIKQLYESSLLFFADRFGFDSLTESVLRQLYTWSYSLRLAMYSIYPQSINKYSKGLHERVNEGTAMFSIISEMNEPGELKLILLKEPDIMNNNDEKYKATYDKLWKWNRW